MLGNICLLSDPTSPLSSEIHRLGIYWSFQQPAGLLGVEAAGHPTEPGSFMLD